jgi:single-strand DNA-binding protein
MSTTVTFAGNLAETPELLYTRENKPFVRCRVLVSRRVQNDEGEWVNDEPIAHNVKIFGSAATHVHDSCGSGDAIFVHGLERTESWPDKETGESAPSTSWSTTTGSARSASRSSTSPRASSAPPARPRPADRAEFPMDLVVQSPDELLAAVPHVLGPRTRLSWFPSGPGCRSPASTSP